MSKRPTSPASPPNVTKKSASNLTTEPLSKPKDAKGNSSDNVPSFLKKDKPSSLKKQASCAGRKTPSFGKDQDVVPPTIAKLASIVKSSKETTEDVYQFMHPKKGQSKKPKILFKRLLIANITLMVVIVLFFICWVVLIWYFLHQLTTPFDVPSGELHSMAQVCHNAKHVSHEEQRCLYYKKKYPDSCKAHTCSSVMLKFLISNESTTSGDLVSVYNIIPYDKNVTVDETPNYTPCDSSAWCMDELCRSVADDDRLDDLADQEPVDGDWGLYCRSDDLPCVYRNLPRTIGVDELECNPTVDCQGGSHGIDAPYYSVSFGVRICNHPLPMFGGKLCWEENAENVNEAIVAIKICHLCRNILPALINTSTTEISSTSGIQTVPLSCMRNNSPGKECTVTCNGIVHYLSKSRNCTSQDGSAGFCYHGICAKLLTNATCTKSRHYHKP